MTVSATVLVVVHLAPVAQRTTTRLTPDPTWIPQRPTTLPPLLLSPLPNSSNSPQTPPMAALVKPHVVATAVRRPSVRYRVPTVGRRQRRSGAVTTLATIFAMLVVSRSYLFFHPFCLSKKCRYRRSACDALARSHGSEIEFILSHHGPCLITIFFCLFAFLATNTGSLVANPVLLNGGRPPSFCRAHFNKMKSNFPFTYRPVLQTSRYT